MLTSLRIGGAAAVMMAALLVGTTLPASSAPYGNTSTPYTSTNTATPAAPGQYHGFPMTDDEAEPILPRAYRSKCDDLDDMTQRLHCFRAEQDEAQKGTEGYNG